MRPLAGSGCTAWARPSVDWDSLAAACVSKRGWGMRPADIAWSALLGVIIAYEIAAPVNELLSEGWDRYLVSRPVIARVVPIMLALHLINALPRSVDPITRFCDVLRRVGGFLNVRRDIA